MMGIDIHNANDITYPLDKNTFDDRFIVYHGTSNIYSNQIESNGWIINDYPYEMEDMEVAYQICNSIGFKGSGAQTEKIKGYCIGDHISHKPAYFTQDYWIARNYSFISGGESIRALLSLITEFSEMINNKTLIDKHVIYLNKQLNDAILRNDIAVNEYRQKISNFEGSLIKEDIKNKLYEIRDKYEKMVQPSNPVVYAVKISPDMFSNWRYIEIFRELNLMSSVDISPSRIIAKINFPNGVNRFRQGFDLPLPVAWDMDKFKDWLFKNKRENKDFAEFYL